MAASPQIVLVDTHIHDFGDKLAGERAAWEALGATLTYARCNSEDDIIEACKDADILVYVGLYTPFTDNVLSQLPKCQLIARYGIGMDSVDLAAATKYGIVVSNAAEYCVPEVADHATALILSLARRVRTLSTISFAVSMLLGYRRRNVSLRLCARAARGATWSSPPNRLSPPKLCACPSAASRSAGARR